MRTTCQAIFLLFLFMSSLSSFAVDGFHYNYIQPSYDKIKLKLDDETIRGDGPSITASFNIASRFFLSATYNDWELENDPFTARVDIRRLGLGYHVAFRPDTDLVFVVTAIKIKLRVDGLSRESSGLSDLFWVRHRPNGRFEISGRLGFTNKEYGLDLFYHFNKRWAAYLTLENNDEFDTRSLGLRYYFGKINNAD